MRLFCTITVLLATVCLPTVFSQRQALFIKKDIVENGKRVARQTSADQMVQNILQWLQGVYTQNSRRIRQGTLREYLPPINTQKPRPFQPVTQGTLTPNYVGDGDNFINGGYPSVGSLTPRPPFTDGGYPSIHPEITPPIQIPGFNGYPTPSKPQPPFPTATGPTGTTGSTGPTGYPTGPTGYPTTGFPSSTGPTGYPSQTNGYPGGPSTAYPAPSTGYPTSSASYPAPSTGYPTSSAGYPTTAYPGRNNFPSSSTEFSTPGTTYPTTDFPNRNNFPSSSTGFSTPGTSATTTTTPSYPSSSTGFSIPGTGYPTTTSYPAPSTSYPSSTTSHTPTTDYITIPPDITTYPGSSTGYPTSSPRPFPTGPPTSQTTTSYPTRGSSPSSTETEPPFTNEPEINIPSRSSTPAPDENTIPSEEPHSSTPDYTSEDTEQTTIYTPSRFGEDDLNHPPHIHAINVECSKEMMTINIEFNRQFDGIIYSKGYYSHPECRYVKENTGQTKYKFTVSLNSCGTEFVNAFDTQGKSYLENVLVLQNEPGIQEVWDTIRSVRCLWEGNLKKVLNVALSVGMLNQEIVTFSGDTAMARLDIQMGKGPFAPSANGLVKIGEVMTLVVSVTGDPGFDIHVKDCRAKDSSGENVVALTDDRGCILKPKLFAAFQKTRNTGNSGASIIAYAFFNAFKFPDVMDLTLECNVDLCKTDCEVCPDPGQKTEPGRRRKRDLYYQNTTDDTSVRIGKMLRVILPEDLSDGNTTINLTQNEGICMSTQGFVLGSALLISLLTSSCLFSAYMWLKYQRVHLKK